MKSGFGIAVAAIAVFLLLGVATVSAIGFNTIIAGKVYQNSDLEHSPPADFANVSVTCNSIEKNTTALGDGTYSILFNLTDGCLNTVASGYATWNGTKSLPQTGNIQNYTSSFDLYLGVINIAMVPEFGVIAGALTLVSAVGIFFLVRKR